MLLFLEFNAQNEKITSKFSESNTNLPIVVSEANDEFELDFGETAVVEVGGTTRHEALSGRDSKNQHPISAISGLQEALDKASNIDTSQLITKSQIGKNLEIDDVGKVNVVTTNNAEQDNTKPITASAVYAIVGNIDALLEII